MSATQRATARYGEAALRGVVVVGERTVPLSISTAVEWRVYAVGCPHGPAGFPSVPQGCSEPASVLGDLHASFDHELVERGRADCGSGERVGGLLERVYCAILGGRGPSAAGLVWWPVMSFPAWVYSGTRNPRRVTDQP